jgi:hypothetical protein
VMNASFEPLHLVNTYGAFGSIERERYEVVVEGTSDGTITGDTVWREYEFRGKPTVPGRRPPQWAPYHLRLDWLMWFAAISPSFAAGWFLPFVRKLLEGDRGVLRLLRRNPFPDRPPRAVRALLYRYRFTTWRERRESGAFWVRTPLGEYLEPVTRLSAGAGTEAMPAASRPRADSGGGSVVTPTANDSTGSEAGCHRRGGSLPGSARRLPLAGRAAGRTFPWWASQRTPGA